MQTTESADPVPGPEEPQDAIRAMPRWVGAVLGVVALAGGLVFAELVASLRDGAISPLVEVGNRVVDVVPKPVRDWAISTFGTSDKAVLLAGVAVILVALAALAGHWMVSGRRGSAVALVALVIAVGAVSPLGRGGAGWGSALATLAGGAVSVALLFWFAGLAGRAWPGAARHGETVAVMGERGAQASVALSRRRFFVATGGTAVVAGGVGALSAWLRSTAAVAAERLGITLPEPATPLAPIGDGVDVGIDGVSPFITPNKDFYRIDTALVVPRVTVDDWSLSVVGRVDNEISLDYQELLDRPMIEVDTTIACVSNEVGGELIGTARWLGCRLDDLLAEAGVDASADQVVGRSVDGFTAGFPTAALDGRDAIVAVGMNGEPLPTDHGYPARLIVPGLFGYVSATKWLSEIELTRFDEFEGYWIPRGWDTEAPVTTASRIDTPKKGASVTAGQPLGIGGVAWAMNRGIGSVEVRIDEGPWQQARLGEEYSGTTWRQWGIELVPEPGEHVIEVRATDNEGQTQSGEFARPGPGASSGWHGVRIVAD